ncbi:MAG: hypothetical protein ABIQ75_04760 [Flavobacteriales bacterium]
MENIVDLANVVSVLSKTGSDPKLYYNKLEELKHKVQAEKDTKLLYEIIDKDVIQLSLPMDILRLIFEKFNVLGERTPKVLEWFGCMLMFYGSSNEWSEGEELVAESKIS